MPGTEESSAMMTDEELVRPRGGYADGAGRRLTRVKL
jgi:hypothetical protein